MKQRNLFNQIRVSISVLGLMLAFQNCSKPSSASAEPAPTTKTGEESTAPIVDNSGTVPATEPVLPISPVVQFSVSKNLSGTQNSLTLSAKVNFASEHLNKSGFLFVGAQLADGRWFFLSDKLWLPYSDATPPKVYKHITALTAGVHEFSILENMDTKDFVGTKIYVGYGIGNTLDLAWKEMLDTTRYKVVHTVE